MNLKQPILRDRAWLDHLRTQPCICLGISGESEPAHIGSAGRGLKSPDDEALPLHYSVHRDCHQYGEMSILRKYLPDDVLRAALRALAREMYREYKESV
jgi:hypothetical protein